MNFTTYCRRGREGSYKILEVIIFIFAKHRIIKNFVTSDMSLLKGRFVGQIWVGALYLLSLLIFNYQLRIA